MLPYVEKSHFIFICKSRLHFYGKSNFKEHCNPFNRLIFNTFTKDERKKRSRKRPLKRLTLLPSMSLLIQCCFIHNFTELCLVSLLWAFLCVHAVVVYNILSDLFFGWIAGKAEPADITSEPKGTEYDRFHLDWTAESYSPISKFRVEFKAVGEENWRSDETTAIKLPHEEKTFQGSYVIPRLRPATVYMARVSSQNMYGYSNPSQVFKFATRGADPVQKPITGNSGLALKSSIASSTIAILISMFLI